MVLTLFYKKRQSLRRSRSVSPATIWRGLFSAASMCTAFSLQPCVVSGQKKKGALSTLCVPSSQHLANELAL